MLASTLLTRSAVEERVSAQSVNRARAIHLGEAGVDVAIVQLRTDPRYVGANDTDLGNRAGGYSVEVTPDGPSRRIILGRGFYPVNDPTALGYSARTIEVVVQMAKVAGPGYGILGERSVRVDGRDDDGGRKRVKLDSYDSRRGPYSPEGAGANVRLATNEHGEQAVALIGGVIVMGDVVLGPGSDPETTLWQVPKGWSSIRGTVSVAETQVPVEPLEMPALPDGGRLSISGHDVVTLPGGLYRFRDLHITGQGQLIFTGPAEVYVEDNVHIAGRGISTAAQLPTNLTCYVQGPHVAIRGNAHLFAKLHAPYATVEISGDGDLYGAVTGREVIVRGRGDIHYDEALNLYDVSLNPPRRTDPLQVQILSWRELDL